MSKLQTTKTDFATIASLPELWPPAGSFIFGFDIADDVFKKIDSAGVITAVGGDTLAQVLLNGSNTGNTPLTSIDGGTFLELSNNFGQITASDGLGITGQMFLDSLNTEAGISLQDGTIIGEIKLDTGDGHLMWQNATAGGKVRINGFSSVLDWNDGVDSGGVLISSTQSKLSHSLIVRLESSTISISSDNVNFAGIQYDSDFSANYTNRSLTDKAYVDAIWPITSSTAYAGGGVSNAFTMSIGMNVLTVATIGDSVKLPGTASVGDTVEIVGNNKYSIFSVTGALIAAFANGAELQPELDVNSAPISVRYTYHTNGKWYYSHQHIEL